MQKTDTTDAGPGAFFFCLLLFFLFSAIMLTGHCLSMPLQTEQNPENYTKLPPLPDLTDTLKNEKH